LRREGLWKDGKRMKRLTCKIFKKPPIRGANNQRPPGESVREGNELETKKTKRMKISKQEERVNFSKCYHSRGGRMSR